MIAFSSGVNLLLRYG